MRRLFSCSVSLVYADAQHEVRVHSFVADRAEFWWDVKRPAVPVLWDSTIQLGEQFFNEIIAHPIPLDLSKDAPFNPQYSFDDPQYQQYIARTFKHVDASGRRYCIDNLANPAERPNLMYEYKGYPHRRTDGRSLARRWNSGTAKGASIFPRAPPGAFAAAGFWTS